MCVLVREYKQYKKTKIFRGQLITDVKYFQWKIDIIIFEKKKIQNQNNLEYNEWYHSVWNRILLMIIEC